MADERMTYLLVDGENIDATLGGNILNRRPAPGERPRWDRLLKYLDDHWDQPVTGLFFMVAGEEIPQAFVQALQAMDYKPILLAGEPDQKVVDIGIQRTLEALADRSGDVVLASHDGDFLPQVEALRGTRRVAVAAFSEFVNSGYRPLFDEDVELLDLERDMHAFKVPLPRLRVIPIDEFDPLEFL